MEIFQLASGAPVWCAGFRWYRDGVSMTEVVDSRDVGAVNRLRQKMLAIGRQEKLLVGYNHAGFDLPIVGRLLAEDDKTPFDVKKLASDLITESRAATGLDRHQLDQARQRLWSGIVDPRRVVDLIFRSPDPDAGSDLETIEKSGENFGLIGLKTFMAQLGHDVTTMPYHHSRELTEEEWSELKDYCLEDLKATETVYEHHAGTVESLYDLSHKYNQNLINLSDSKVGELVIRSEFELRTKQKPPRVATPSSFMVYNPGNIPEFKSESVREWVNFVLRTRFRLEDGKLRRTVCKKTGARPEPETLEVPRVVTIGDYQFQVAFGGLHQIIEPGHYGPRDGFKLISVDVRSYYPSIASEHALPLGGMGSVGTSILREIMQERFKHKDRSEDESLTEEERGASKVASDSLKIVVNALFGRSGYRYSSCYAPGTLYSITILGQIYLLNLIEMLVSKGVIPVDSNTDGIYCLVPEDLDLDSELREWERSTGFKLEDKEIQGLVVQAQNIRATKQWGKWFGKGTGFASISGKNPGGKKIDPPIVAKSVIEALVNRVPLSKTIHSSTIAKDFVFTKKYAGATEVGLLSDSGERTRLDSLIRIYASKSGSKIVTSSERGDSSIPDRVGLAYKAPLSIPGDLDRSFYLGKARDLLSKFNGAFRAEELSGLALEVWNEGLVPSPGYLKSALKGVSDKGQASSLEEWDRISTIRAFTGPRPGGVEEARVVIAIDIDDPQLVRDKIGLGIDEIRNSECLTVYSGESPDEVRSGQSKGKIIFEFDAPVGHRFRRMRSTSNADLKKIGVEIFYGQRPLAVLGQGVGKEYKLSGTLSPLPERLEAFLLKHAGKNPPPKKPGKVDPDAVFDHETDPDFDAVLSDLGERFDERFKDVSYRLKRRSGERDGVQDNRAFIVFDCPGGHDSGNLKGSLLLDWDTGRPAFHCKSEGCELYGRFREWDRQPVDQGDEDEEDEPEDIDVEQVRQGLSEIGRVMADPENKVLMVHAGTGGGKTHAAVDSIYLDFRAGKSVLFMAPSKQNLMDFERVLKTRYPKLRDHIHNLSLEGEPSGKGLDSENYDDYSEDDDVEEDELDSEEAPEVVVGKDGERFINEAKQTIFLACHEMSRRRGYSRLLQRVWATLAKVESVNIYIDESHLYFRQLSVNYPLQRRITPFITKGGKFRTKVVHNCPASRVLHKGGTGGCETCELIPVSACYDHDSTFGIPSLASPKINDRKSLYDPLVFQHGDPVTLSEEWLTMGPEVQVDPDLNPGSYYEPILAVNGRALSDDVRRDLPRWTYRSNHTHKDLIDENGVPKKDEQAEGLETVPLVFEHLIGHLHGAAVKTSYPTDKDGNRLSREDVLKIPKGIRYDQVIFPTRVCESQRVQGLDLAPMEMLREYVQFRGSRVIFMSASFGDLDRSVLDTTFKPEGWTYGKVEGQPAKIGALQVVTVFDDLKPDFKNLLQNVQPRWIELWKEFGPGLMFAPCESAMKLLHRSFIRKSSGRGRRAVSLNVQVAQGSGAELSPLTTRTSHDGIDLTIATPRKPVATGYDGKELVFAFIDYRSTRLAEDLVVPGTAGPEHYRAAVMAELLDYLAQAAGRLARGDSEKRIILVIANGTEIEARQLLEAGGLIDRVESVDYVNYPRFRKGLFESGARFLNGEGWIVGDDTPEPYEHWAMPEGHRETKRGRAEDEILVQALKWKEDGKTRRSFEMAHNIIRKDKTSLPGIKDAVRKVWTQGNLDLEL